MRTLYFCPVVSFYLFLFLTQSQPLQIGRLPCFDTWCGLGANLECMSEMCCTRLAGNTGCKKSPSAHHRTTLSGYIFATKALIDNRKKLVKQQYLPHVLKYGELRPTNGWDLFGSLGYPANFSGFRILALLLQRRRSPEANQTLHNVWQSSRLVHHIYIFGALAPWQNFARCKIHCIQVLPSMLAALLHGSPAVGVSQTLRPVQGMELRNFHWGRRLYLAGRPSRWASAHILVVFILCSGTFLLIGEWVLLLC